MTEPDIIISLVAALVIGILAAGSYIYTLNLSLSSTRDDKNRYRENAEENRRAYNGAEIVITELRRRAELARLQRTPSANATVRRMVRILNGEEQE